MKLENEQKMKNLYQNVELLALWKFFGFKKKSDTDQTCIFCECCRVAPPVVAAGGAIRNLMLQPDRNPQLVAEAAVVLTSLLRKSKPRCSFLETAGCCAVICKQVISQTTTPASYSFVGK